MLSDKLGTRSYLSAAFFCFFLCDICVFFRVFIDDGKAFAPLQAFDIAGMLREIYYPAA
jgi:hypothetical protein